MKTMCIQPLTLVHVNGMSLGRLSTKCWTIGWPRTWSAVAAPHTLSSFSPAFMIRMSRSMITPNGNSRSNTPTGMDGNWRRSNVCTAAYWSTYALLSKSSRYLTSTFWRPIAFVAAADGINCVVVFSSWSTRIFRFVSYTSLAIWSSCPATQQWEKKNRYSNDTLQTEVRRSRDLYGSFRAARDRYGFQLNSYEKQLVGVLNRVGRRKRKIFVIISRYHKRILAEKCRDTIFIY